MRRDELEHLIRAAGAILREGRIIVVGSQAVLASLPEEGLPAEATRSVEADLLPPDDPEGRKADLIDGTIGEGSPFHEAFAVYAHGVGAIGRHRGGRAANHGAIASIRTAAPASTGRPPCSASPRA